MRTIFLPEIVDRKLQPCAQQLKKKHRTDVIRIAIQRSLNKDSTQPLSKVEKRSQNLGVVMRALLLSRKEWRYICNRALKEKLSPEDFIIRAVSQFIRELGIKAPRKSRGKRYPIPEDTLLGIPISQLR